MIETFYNVTAIPIRRSVPTPTSTDVITTGTSVSGVYRPIAETSSLYVENNIGKEFSFYCDDSADIRVGDDLYISGIKYSVLGVSMFEDLTNQSDNFLNVRIVR